ncbi:MAG: efflux RND transporter periplasmic adaptor subunit [Holosporales bacterium]|jgi:membrane fusion protein (multidrug efflux system)|nr:efflux RND transporter periplasmic adaptor subunit [Holosporales bacterium]
MFGRSIILVVVLVLSAFQPSCIASSYPPPDTPGDQTADDQAVVDAEESEPHESIWQKVKRFFHKFMPKKSEEQTSAADEQEATVVAEPEQSNEAQDAIATEPTDEAAEIEQGVATADVEAAPEEPHESLWEKVKRFFHKFIPKKSEEQVGVAEGQEAVNAEPNSNDSEQEAVSAEPVAEPVDKAAEQTEPIVAAAEAELSEPNKSIWQKIKQFLRKFIPKKSEEQPVVTEEAVTAEPKPANEGQEVAATEPGTGNAQQTVAEPENKPTDDVAKTEQGAVAVPAEAGPEEPHKSIWQRIKQFFCRLFSKKSVEQPEAISGQEAATAESRSKTAIESIGQAVGDAEKPAAESSKSEGFFSKLFSKKKEDVDTDMMDALKKLQNADPVVDVASARLGQVQHVTNLIGTLRASNDCTIKSEVDGRISRILFEEGRKVNEGDVLLEVDSAAMRIHMREISAQLTLAKAEYKRAQDLASKEFLSKSELDKKYAEVMILESKLAAVKEELSKYKVRAPFAGVVGLREISVGDYVTKSKEMLRIVSDQDIRVDFKVPEMIVAGMEIGQTVYIKIDGVHGEFPAEVLAINPEADQMSHSFVVRAVMQYQNEDMRPGLFVRVSVPNTTSSEAILVPESAISRVGDNDVVFRVVDGMAIKTPVTIGIRQSGEVEILTGINADDVVITAGHMRVRDGSTVQISTGLEGLEQ